MADKTLSFALFGNEYQISKSEAVRTLLDTLMAHNARILLDKPYLGFIRHQLGISLKPDSVISGNDFLADYAVSMGGDGTLLHVAARVGSKNIPIIGVNMGRLGFLADIMPSEIPAAFDNIFAGNIAAESHSLIRIDTEGDDVLGSPYALNDIAVLKRDNASMISVHITINGEYVGNYLADGIIVATPTGSTAYSLSNGGPIIVPQSSSLCITPVAPHSLSIRPIVIRDDSRIELKVDSRTHNFLVAVDGRSQKMHDTTLITITKASHNIQIIRNPEHRYFSTLRKKMMWGADQR
ncbi:MAG: NAD kinase [Prevotella sp.]|jgi:NAD+ kinase